MITETEIATRKVDHINMSSHTNKNSQYTQNQPSLDHPLCVESEIGVLKKVLVHEPGPEVEYMNPSDMNANLFLDLVFLKKLSQSHHSLTKALSKNAKVIKFKSALETALSIAEAKHYCLDKILAFYDKPELKNELWDYEPKYLAQILIQGYTGKNKQTTIPNDLSKLILPPLHNLYFSRDASVVVGHHYITSHMTHKVRRAENILTKTLFQYHPDFSNAGELWDSDNHSPTSVFIEGGDVHVWNKNLYLVGLSERTNKEAVELFTQAILKSRNKYRINEPFQIVCIKIPRVRSMIHLDMIFSQVSNEHVLVYGPLVLERDKLEVTRLTINPDGTKAYKEYDELMRALKDVGFKLDPILCGGDNPLFSAREQWASGANSVALAPGQVLIYDHDKTLRAFEDSGFKILNPDQYLEATVRPDQKIAVAFDGSESLKGGGGPRCMTCPLVRAPVTT